MGQVKLQQLVHDSVPVEEMEALSEEAVAKKLDEQLKMEIGKMHQQEMSQFALVSVLDREEMIQLYASKRQLSAAAPEGKPNMEKFHAKLMESLRLKHHAAIQEQVAKYEKLTGVRLELADPSLVKLNQLQ